MLPVLLAPAFKDYLWGGERLKTLFRKKSDLSPLAESWELSCHPDGPSRIVAGPEAGKTLADALGGDLRLLGENCAGYPDFPLLIKLIDAQKPLSIQVHPDDGYARRYENSNGKTEMWYVLDALPGSFVYYGVKRPVTANEMREAIAANTLEALLDKRPVKRCDVIFIPAGTLHAIGAGMLVCEVQQNSNLTYRVYDYGRLGADGRPRDLHVDKALAVSTLTPARGGFSPMGEPASQDGVQATLLVQCGYFQTYRLDVQEEFGCATCGDSFHSLVCIGGGGTLECGGQSLSYCLGDSLFVPADAGNYTLRGACSVILTGVLPSPDKQNPKSPAGIWPIRI